MNAPAGTLPPPELPDWLARMLPGFERYRVRAGEWAVHVMELGPRDGLPVVMVHGNPTWGFLYRHVAEALAADGLRLILPDLPGLGLSDKPRDPRAHTLANHGRWMGEVLAALDVRAGVFVVQDWGGPIALRALADAPERAAGLVVLNTVLGPPKPGFKPTAFHRFARMPVVSDLAFGALEFPQRALWLAQGDRGSIRGDVSRAYRWPLRKRADRVAPLALARMVPDSLAHPSVPELARVAEFVGTFRGPAAIVWGDRDPVLGRTRARAERSLPQASVTRTGAGHFLQEEVPEQIAAAVRSVAARVRGG